ncbi:alpha/beta hydrolase [Robiginitalea sp. M366]|uniref:alpha/beta hydrolase n=1 Tax=Robiginitalea aestuariiviva TaxID=3036903 RepID=UPI00240D7C66|nr:alpha/beta hydrolase [Robiginitalea aestuariiviva]MDG1572689.1 alpha/beta hydrolase [Robiginitalea aestuariiviva]
MLRNLIYGCAVLLCLGLQAQDHRLPLWPEGEIPYRVPTDETEVRDSTNILRISKVQTPDLAVYLPPEDLKTGQAVLIFPGGGYHILAYHWEGTHFAKWLNQQGIAGIVVKYRLPVSRSAGKPELIPLSDAQRAMRLVRAHAGEWGVDPARIGVMGFSAGGHLAASLSTQYASEVYPPVDARDSLSARPDFSALIYPVISFTTDAVHAGSRAGLLGPEPDPDLQRFFSPELQTGPKTPPAFLLHATDDGLVPVENSLLYYQALRENGVAATLHVVPAGGHGFAMAKKEPHLSHWLEWLAAWLQAY